MHVRSCQSVKTLMSCKLKCEAESGLPNSKICTFTKKVWKLSPAGIRRGGVGIPAGVPSQLSGYSAQNPRKWVWARNSKFREQTHFLPFFAPRFLREDLMFSPISQQPTVETFSTLANRLITYRSIHWCCPLACKKSSCVDPKPLSKHIFGAHGTWKSHVFPNIPTTNHRNLSQLRKPTH